MDTLGHVEEWIRRAAVGGALRNLRSGRHARVAILVTVSPAKVSPDPCVPLLAYARVRCLTLTVSTTAQCGSCLALVDNNSPVA